MLYGIVRRARSLQTEFLHRAVELAEAWGKTVSMLWYPNEVKGNYFWGSFLLGEKYISQITGCSSRYWRLFWFMSENRPKQQLWLESPPNNTTIHSNYPRLILHWTERWVKQGCAKNNYSCLLQVFDDSTVSDFSRNMVLLWLCLLVGRASKTFT